VADSHEARWEDCHHDIGQNAWRYGRATIKKKQELILYESMKGHDMTIESGTKALGHRRVWLDDCD